MALSLALVARFLGSFVFWTLAAPTEASAGDHSLWYKHCLDTCVKKECPRALRGSGHRGSQLASSAHDLQEFRRTDSLHEARDDPPGKDLGGNGFATHTDSVAEDQFFQPWYLRVMGWDCESECGYNCMTQHVELCLHRGLPVLQYHGKWPFRRIWGIQELFASLGSALNGLPHLYHLVNSSGQYNPPGHYMRFWLTLYPWVGINTWLWSTVFHARDVRWTEAADYFCALFNIFFSLWVAFLRVAGPPSQRRRCLKTAAPGLGLGLTVFYAAHVYRMCFIKFDYGLNMKVALVAGLMHSGLWLRYQFRAWDRPYARHGALIVFLLNAAILLEVGDFPPVFYRLIDAHAVWHLLTVPLGFEWYRFLIRDARYEASHDQEKGT